MFNDDRVGPRHLSTGKCLCQFVEEHFKNNNNNNIKEQRSEQHYDNEQLVQQSTIQSNYLSNTDQATLAFSGLKQRQQSYNQETLIKPQLIHNQQMATRIVPTLSGLVSFNESRPLEHLKIDMETINQQYRSPYLKQINGSAAISNSWNQQQQPNEKHFINQLTVPITSQTALSSPDVSLEMDSDSIVRSDDLVRKLRLLLELRKNELQGLDGSLFSSILNKTPQPFTPFDEVANEHPISNDVSTRANNSVVSSKDNNLVKVNDGKKFCNQREGLFFFGSSGTKKSQNHNGTNRNHALEIC